MVKHSTRRKFAITYTSVSNREEFFRLPRIEFLVNQPHTRKEISSRDGEIGKMIINQKMEFTDRFSLLVEDNRMAADGITKGDYVIIQKRQNYGDSEIVAVQIGKRILIRRLYQKSSRIRLECPPPTHQTIILDKETPGFSILGSVIQVIREI